MNSLLLTLALSIIIPFSPPVGGSLHDAPDGGQIWVGTKTQQARGPQDIWVIKTNAIGQEIWSKTYGGSSWDRGADIQPTRDGGYILLGSTSSYGVGNYDAFLLKLDAAGEVEWQQTYGAFHNDYGLKVVELQDGYQIDGQQQLCGSQNDFSTCLDVPWRLKTDANGNLKWQARGSELSY